MRTMRIMLIVLCLSLFAMSPAMAMTFEEALSGANQDIERDFGRANYFQMQNKQGKPINKETWAGRCVFAYGQPYDFQADRNFHRFLGYAMSGEPFTNIRLPHDAWAGGYLEDRNWITEPWDDSRVRQVVASEGGLPLDISPFNNQPMLRESMRAGLDQEYTPSSLRGDNVAWEKYVHVFAPPTEYTWGMGRMWHQTANGQIWYKTVPMAPSKMGGPDFSVELQPKPGFEGVAPGERLDGNVIYRLNKDHGQNETARLKLYHQTNTGNYPTYPDGEVIELEPGQEYGFAFAFNAQDANTTIVAEIEPVSTPDDKDWSNNRDELTVTVVKPRQPQGNGNLTFQAISRLGEMRTPNTAKWTDTVTAKLVAPGPPPDEECGPITTKWELKTARLTYPDVHPNFVWASPVEPTGTRTINMIVDSNNNTAEVDFNEDWSVNGADIFDMLKGKMVPGPTHYPISVRCEIIWEYYTKPDTCCNKYGCWCCGREDHETTVTRTVGADLLVNGSGTIGVGA